VVVSVIAITLDITGRAHVLTSGSKSVAGDIYSPMRNAVNDVLNPIGRFLAGSVHYNALQAQNQQLRAEIATLQLQNDSQWYQSRQYHQLQKLLSLEKLPSISNLPVVVAQSTSQAISNFAATITINKGRDNGVAVGDPVLGGGGLAGQVVAASRSSATVRLITDGLSRVGVVFGTNEYATLAGLGARKSLNAEFVADKTPVHAGQLMTTSGLSGAIFPAGIPVARVGTVHAIAGALDKSVTAKPIANLQDLAYVAVLEWAPAP